MKNKSHTTAFYLETLLMIIVFVSIIVMLTGILGIARVQSVQARELNDAVCLAENAAEAVSASESAEDLASLLGGSVEDGEAVAWYDRSRKPVSGTEENRFYQVRVSWEPAGELVSSSIRVFGEKELYSLDTAVYVR
ncbi:MAG: hypothetical protein IJG52_02860 [Lachnospiraceae bacterium]|nr:hypothetical protein [Lachnospiraceae bacterium]